MIGKGMMGLLLSARKTVCEKMECERLLWEGSLSRVLWKISQSPDQPPKKISSGLPFLYAVHFLAMSWIARSLLSRLLHDSER